MLLLAGVLSVGLSLAVLARAIDGAMRARAGQPAAASELAASVVAGATQTPGRTQAAARSTTPAASPTVTTPTATATPASASEVQLRAAILEALGPDADHYAVAVRRPADGLHVDVDGERVFYAASLFKLAVLYEAEREQAAGELSLDDTVTLTGEDVAEDLGTLSRLGAGEGDAVPVGRLLEAMVTYSDNVSAVALLHRFTGRAIDASLAELGLRNTSVNTEALPTTAADMALLMEAIVTGEGASAGGSAAARALLERQEVRWGIPAGLAEGVVAGNKTGNWEGATHDVGFVDAPGGTYVIAVLSDTDFGWGPITRVSAAVYAVMTKGAPVTPGGG